MRLPYLLAAVSIVTSLLVLATSVHAQITPLTIPNPQDNSFGIEGVIPAPPPDQGATIVTPGNGANFNDQPVATVSGLCPTDLLVKVLVNNAFMGSTMCQEGSFSLQVSLFFGQNDIVAYVYDNLDQEGPPSNTVSVFFNNANFQAFGTLITLTSSFHRRAANPNTTLTWPLQLTGGTGPYAFSIDWGDGSEPQLVSQPIAGDVNINHVYKNAGIYYVVVKVTDVNGVSAFLQLVAIANGSPTGGITVPEDSIHIRTNTVTKVIWQPAAAILILAFPAFWLGRRYEIAVLRKQIESDAQRYRN